MNNTRRESFGRVGSTTSRQRANYSSIPVVGSDTEGTEDSFWDSNALHMPAQQNLTSATNNATKADEKKPTRVTAPLPILTDEEEKFFDRVKKGDRLKVAEILESGFEKMHINRFNVSGYTVLHIAVRRQDEEMVKLLLEQPGIKVFDTILHAIAEKNVEITKLLIAADKKEWKGLSAEEQTKCEEYSAKLYSGTGIKSVMRQLEARDNPKNVTQQESKSKAGGVSTISEEDDEGNNERVHDDFLFDSEFHSVITPLMLAAQMGSIPLMTIFHDMEDSLESGEFNHNKACRCRICSKSESSQVDMTLAYKRLHLFRAITDPMYICFMATTHGIDPVNYAIAKIIKIREIIKREAIFDKLYLELPEKLETFIGDLLGECKTTAETEAFMSHKDSTKKLPHDYPRLWYAVGLQLKQFVAQPHSQNLIAKMWATDGWPMWNRLSIWWRLFHLSLRCAGGFIIVPLLVFLSGCGGTFHKKYSSPVSRFLNHLASYLVFLVILGYQVSTPHQRCNTANWGTGWFDESGEWIRDDSSDCLQRGPPNTGFEWVLVAFVVGFLISIFKRSTVTWYWTMKWNWVELVSMLFLLAAFICWGYSFYTTADQQMERTLWPHDSAEILADCFIAAGTMLAYARLLRFIQLLPEIGPMQVGVGKQLYDFFTTSFIYLIMILAFVSGLLALYAPYKDFVGYDENNKLKKQDDTLGRPLSSIHHLYYAFKGDSDTTKAHLLKWQINLTDGSGSHEDVIHHTLNEATGVYMLMVFSIVGNVMLSSVLEGYFAATFEEATKDAEVVWKFTRAELYMAFVKDTFFAPPISFLPSSNMLSGCKKFCTSKEDREDMSCNCRDCCFFMKGSKRTQHEDRTREYKVLLPKLIERYRKTKDDDGGDASRHDVLEIGEELDELKSELQILQKEAKKTQEVKESWSKSVHTVHAASKFKVHKRPPSPSAGNNGGQQASKFDGGSSPSGSSKSVITTQPRSGQPLSQARSMSNNQQSPQKEFGGESPSKQRGGASPQQALQPITPPRSLKPQKSMSPQAMSPLPATNQTPQRSSPQPGLGGGSPPTPKRQGDQRGETSSPAKAKQVEATRVPPVLPRPLQDSEFSESSDGVPHPSQPPPPPPPNQAGPHTPKRDDPLIGPDWTPSPKKNARK